MTRSLRICISVTTLTACITLGLYAVADSDDKLSASSQKQDESEPVNIGRELTYGEHGKDPRSDSFHDHHSPSRKPKQSIKHAGTDLSDQKQVNSIDDVKPVTKDSWKAETNRIRDMTPVVGGAEPEKTDSAERRVPEKLQYRDRAQPPEKEKD